MSRADEALRVAADAMEEDHDPRLPAVRALLPDISDRDAFREAERDRIMTRLRTVCGEDWIERPWSRAWVEGLVRLGMRDPNGYTPPSCWDIQSLISILDGIDITIEGLPRVGNGQPLE